MDNCNKLHHLSWDSDFFKFPVARLSVTNSASIIDALDNARLTNYRLLYITADPVDLVVASVMRDIGACLVDRKVTFKMNLFPSINVHTISDAIKSTTEYTSQLEKLAWQSGIYSRFRIDKNFPSGVYKNLYSKWLRNSLTGVIARQVLVWHDGAGNELGLLTLGEKNNRADIGLLAVDSTARGQRIGLQLVAAAQIQAANWGYSELQVVTQLDNVSACRFYEKCGFILNERKHIYHFWID